MKRRIVSLSGQDGRIAIADDGSVWFWGGTAWTPWARPDLPDKEGVDFYAGVEQARTATMAAQQAQDKALFDGSVPDARRRPGRPRRVRP